MRNFSLGLIIGLCLILCIAATYKLSVKPDIYTVELDPNDAIYNRLSVDKTYIQQFGNCERTVVFYNIVLNRVRIEQLEKTIAQLQKANDPNLARETSENIKNQDTAP